MTAKPIRRRNRFLVSSVVVTIATALSIASPPASAQMTPPPGVVWLALGDSYSSGEGLRYVDQQANPTVDADGKPGGVTCERATGDTSVAGVEASRAYAKVAYDHVRGDWTDSDFKLLACTGAISNEVHAQYTIWRDSDTKADLVTISMGGNNLGFADVVLECAGLDITSSNFDVTGLAPWVGCGESEQAIRHRIDQLVTFEPGASGPYETQALPDMYRQIADDVVQPGGHIVVLGYPNLIEESSGWSLGWFEGNRCSRISRADTAMLRSATGYLNNQLALMVGRLDGHNAVNFHWLDVSQVYENDQSGRHGLCTGEPWINGITVGWAGPQSGRVPARLMRSFHPNQKGHDATGLALANLIRELAWEPTTNERWDLIKNANIPSFCMHEPTQLVDGIDPNPTGNSEHPGGDPGYFSLIEDPVAAVQSPLGVLTVVGAACSAGGVNWGPHILFFDSDGQYVTSTDLWDFNWKAIGLEGPGRGPAQRITVRGPKVNVEVDAYISGDAGCCASGSAVISIEIDSSGKVIFPDSEPQGETMDDSAEASTIALSPEATEACVHATSTAAQAGLSVQDLGWLGGRLFFGPEVQQQFGAPYMMAWTGESGDIIYQTIDESRNLSDADWLDISIYLDLTDAGQSLHFTSDGSTEPSCHD